MNRYRAYGRLDDPIEVVGDGQFVRLDMRTDPATLPQGTVQRSENFRFDESGARVRRGIARMLGAGVDLEQIRHASVYRPDNDHDRLALLCQEKMYLFDPSTQSAGTAKAYPMAGGSYVDGERILTTDRVDFIQGGVATGTTCTAYILRGLSKDVLKYDGSSLSKVTDFTKGEFGVFYQDRMAVNSERQKIAVSDFLDFTTWTDLSQFQILYGSDDRLMGMRAWQKDFVIIGTQKRFFIARFMPAFDADGGGYEGGLDASNSFLHLLTEEAGLLGPDAWIEAGGAIWFLAHTGIYAFQPRLDLELTVLGEPISAPIQPIINRVNATAAVNAQFARLGYRIYVALPVNPDEEPLKATAVALQNPLVIRLTGFALGAHYGEQGDEGVINGTNQSAINNEASWTVTTVVDNDTLDFECALGTAVVVSGDLGVGTTYTGPGDAPQLCSGSVYQRDAAELTFTTLTPHGLAAGDTVNVIGANQTAANGTFTVNEASEYSFNVRTDAVTSSEDLGDRIEVRRLAVRNNMIAVYNLANQAWESIDVLHPDLKADWLVVADYLTERRLYLVDRDQGPFLYEQGEVDELSSSTGGAVLPFTLPRQLATTTFDAAPVAARLTSRTYRWGPHARKVLAAETRLRTADGDSGTMAVTVQSPDQSEWTSARAFDDSREDTAARKRCGRRGLEAEIEVTSSTGRPAVRSMLIETAVVGRVKEE